MCAAKLKGGIEMDIAIQDIWTQEDVNQYTNTEAFKNYADNRMIFRDTDCYDLDESAELVIIYSDREYKRLRARYKNDNNSYIVLLSPGQIKKCFHGGFNQQQINIILYGFWEGYSDEIVELYANTKIPYETMEDICENIRGDKIPRDLIKQIIWHTPPDQMSDMMASMYRFYLSLVDVAFHNNKQG